LKAVRNAVSVLPGFILSITNYFLTHSSYNIDEAVESLSGNILADVPLRRNKTHSKKCLGRIDNENNNEKSQIDFLVKIGILRNIFCQSRV
jgi:hypothetical protein